MATSQAGASNAASSSNEHVMASAVTLPSAAETSINRGKRRICDGRDLEKACLEQEIEDLKAECKKMRLVHESQLGITTVLRSKNQSLENELAHAKRKIASLEKTTGSCRCQNKPAAGGQVLIRNPTGLGRPVWRSGGARCEASVGFTKPSQWASRTSLLLL